jgi:hypothetical protein
MFQDDQAPSLSPQELYVAPLAQGVEHFVVRSSSVAQVRNPIQCSR